MIDPASTAPAVDHQPGRRAGSATAIVVTAASMPPSLRRQGAAECEPHPAIIARRFAAKSAICFVAPVRIVFSASIPSTIDTRE